MKEMIKDILEDITETMLDLPKLEQSQDLINDLNLSSLHLMTFFFEIENRLEIEVDIFNMDISSFKTLDSLCSELEKHKN